MPTIGQDCDITLQHPSVNGGAAVGFLLLRKPPRKGLVAVAAVVALVGIAAGYATSMFWWRGVRVWERFLR